MIRHLGICFMTSAVIGPAYVLSSASQSVASGRNSAGVFVLSATSVARPSSVVRSTSSESHT